MNPGVPPSSAESLLVPALLAPLFIAFVISLAAGAFSAVVARTHKQLCAFISLGAGTLLGVAICGIAPECLHALSWWQLLLAAASGYVLFALVSRFVFHICPACAASHFDEATTHRLAEFALAMMIALSIHCTADGLALAVGHRESPAVNLELALAICAHKFPEGLALGALLLGGGFGRARMLWLVAGVESTTIWGGLAGWFVLRNVSPFWLALVLAHAGGGFFYLALHAVLGEIFKHHKKLVLANFTAGFVLIAVIMFYFRLRG